MRRLVACPMPWSSSANLRTLLQVHRHGDSGSPRVNGSIISLQVALEGGVGRHGLAASASGPTDPIPIGGHRGPQLSPARSDRTPRDPGRPRHSGDAAATDSGCFNCGGQATGPFVEERREHLESGLDLGFVHHTYSVGSETPDLLHLCGARPLSAESAGRLYRMRWESECFFKTYKRVVKDISLVS